MPARPWSQAPPAAASSGGTPWARSAPITPDSTSPVPAVARRASPAVTSRARPSGWATTVVGPFSSTIAPVAAARSRAAARRSSPGGRPARRANSPSCGVSTVGPRRPVRAAAGSPPSAVSPSPSTTAGTTADDTSWSTAASVGALRPSPGPMTRAPARSSCSSTTVSHPAAGTATPTASVGRPGSWSTPGDATRTIPAPARCAARAARWAAPVIPREPAATTTAARHLWASAWRGGTHAATSARSTTPARARDTSRPMSASTTSPASARPGWNTSPGLSAANVTVRTASTAPPGAAPVSPSTPLGMSTASTGAPAGSGGRYSPWKPVPKAASITRSLAGSVSGASATGMTTVRTPRRRSRRAASRPSLPLLPFPATTTTRRP